MATRRMKANGSFSVSLTPLNTTAGYHIGSYLTEGEAETVRDAVRRALDSLSGFTLK